MTTKNFIPMNDATMKVSRSIQLLASALHAVINKEAGEPIPFTLMVYTQGRANYVSDFTIKRVDEIRGIKRLLELWKNQDRTTASTGPAAVKLGMVVRELAEAVDSLIADIAGESVGYSLIIYLPSRPMYAGTVNRDDAIRELTGLVEMWESGMLDIPAHEVQ